MKSVYEYLLRPEGDRYNNVKLVEGKELILNSTIDQKDFKFVNRIGVIEQTPRKEGVLKAGDRVIVHHNVFRKWYNVRGKLKDSSNLIKDDVFSADLDQIYAYDRGDGWVTLEDYCFVKPIMKKIGGFETVGLYETEVGTIYFSNPILEAQGVFVGGAIGFRKNSEYRFDIDGETLYKMSALKDVMYVKI